MATLRITAGPYTFKARWEEKDAPKTVAAVRRMLPLRSKLVHVPLERRVHLGPDGREAPRRGLREPHQSSRARARSSIYPGGISEMEILFPYGSCLFSSKVGQLAGNHFATVIEGNEHLAEIGRLTLWEGAQDFVVEEV